MSGRTALNNIATLIVTSLRGLVGSKNLSRLSFVCAMTVGISIFSNQAFSGGVPQYIPAMQITDIKGVQLSTRAQDSRVQVFTFADQQSAERLQEVMLQAQLQVMSQNPDMDIAFLSFADLSSVPSAFHSTARLAIELIDSFTKSEMEEMYEQVGVKLNPEKASFVLVPDWSGEYIQQFGFSNATQFHCVIAYNNQVRAVVSEGHPNLIGTVVDTINALAQEQGS